MKFIVVRAIPFTPKHNSDADSGALIPLT